MKRLVVLCDGTWSGPRVREERDGTPTNVEKLALGVAAEDADGHPQLVHYQPGVGTARFEHLWGGVFGFGLSRDLQACYRFLVEEYEPGDAIYVIGFSRGAFTARSLAGLMRNVGVLRPEHRDRIRDAYRLYRSGGDRRHPDGAAAVLFRRRYAHPDPGGRLVHFVGVWDTVGALGIPGAPAWLARGRWGFHDTTLSSRIGNAFHALAIDERRALFLPTLWERTVEDPGQAFEQVWFPGVHRDVGGGYPEPGLAEVPLLWLAGHAVACGLQLRPGHLRRVEGLAADDAERAAGGATAADPLGPAHESRTGPYRLVPAIVRPLAEDRERRRTALAATALDRVGTDGYALPPDASELPVVDVALRPDWEHADGP